MTENLLTYNQRTLKSVWTGWDMQNGIFHYLSQHDFTFADIVPFDDLDLDYYAFQSGRKQSTAAVLNMLDDNGVLPNLARERIANVIYNRFHEKWEKLFRAFVNEYTPFTTYADTEVSSTVGTATEAADRNKSRTLSSLDERTSSTSDVASAMSSGENSDNGTETRTTSGNDSNSLERQGTEARTRTETETGGIDNGVFGFNSATAVQSAEQDNEATRAESELVSFDGRKDVTANERAETQTNLHGNTFETKTAESTTGQTENNTSGSRTDSGSETEAEQRKRDTSRTRTVTRQGFNGAIADLVKDYIALWRDDFYQIVFKDVDDYLALSVY